jgi:hypothetical protein
LYVPASKGMTISLGARPSELDAAVDVTFDSGKTEKGPNDTVAKISDTLIISDEASFKLVM